MTEPNPYDPLRRELKALQAEHRRILEGASYRLGRLLVGASHSPRALVRLPLDLLRLAKDLRRHKRPPRPGTLLHESVRQRWHTLATHVRSGNPNALVFLFSGTTYIQGTRGNRPIRQAQALLARGVPVLFSYHRTRFADDLPEYDVPSLVQSPVDITLQLLEEVAATDLGDAGKLFVVSYPYPGIDRFVDVFRRRGWSVVYDCRDDWEEFAKVGMARWFDATVERQLVATVDRTFCVSRPLVEKMQRLAQGSCVELMPNALEADLLPKEYRRVPEENPRIVGYFGHLSPAWFDWESFSEIARRCPNYRFEVIGHSAPDGLSLPENVKMPGPKPWQELHRFAARWSAAIIPFRMGPLADGVDPIKIYEYLAFGLPVVSFRMPQISDYPYTTTVDNVSAFCDALEDACATETERVVIDAFLARNTWEIRVSQLLAVLTPST